MSETGALMDAIYTSQRHIYDATRKFYLLGRDDLIADLAPPKNGRILEVGCGTARNLIATARRYPDVACFGLDISKAMLATAAKNVAKSRMTHRICLAEADATRFDPTDLFGIATFDRIFISYALSMIPPWREVLHHTATLLAPGGSLHVVDFGDQAELPAAFKKVLLGWLARFHVSPRADLADMVDIVSREQGLLPVVKSRFRGYAVSADLRRT